MARNSISAANVLSEIILSGIVSRRDLCKKLGASKAAMTAIVSKLIDGEFVEEGSYLREARRGRKTISLIPREDIVYFLGTDIEGTAIRACLINHKKRIVASTKRKLGPNWSTDKTMKHWNQVIEEVITHSGVDTNKIAGIGVGMPGKIELNSNLRTRACMPPGEWMEIDIGNTIKKLNLGLTVANNAFCVAEYERRLGEAQNVTNFTSVLIRYGIGLAVFLNNSFLAGERFLTGELGHTKLVVNGPECICGQTGCLDIYVSGRTWAQKQLTSDDAIKKELAKRSQFLSIGLGNLFKIFHPNLLIVNGIYNDYEYEFGPMLHTSLSQELESMRLPVPKIIFGNPVEFKVSIGAALLAADKFLEPYFEKQIF